MSTHYPLDLSQTKRSLAPTPRPNSLVSLFASRDAGSDTRLRVICLNLSNSCVRPLGLTSSRNVSKRSPAHFRDLAGPHSVASLSTFQLYDCVFRAPRRAQQRAVLQCGRLHRRIGVSVCPADCFGPAIAAVPRSLSPASCGDERNLTATMGLRWSNQCDAAATAHLWEYVLRECSGSWDSRWPHKLV